MIFFDINNPGIIGWTISFLLIIRLLRFIYRQITIFINQRKEKLKANLINNDIDADTEIIFLASNGNITVDNSFISNHNFIIEDNIKVEGENTVIEENIVIGQGNIKNIIIEEDNTGSIISEDIRDENSAIELNQGRKSEILEDDDFLSKVDDYVSYKPAKKRRVYEESVPNDKSDDRYNHFEDDFKRKKDTEDKKDKEKGARKKRGNDYKNKFVNPLAGLKPGDTVSFSLDLGRNNSEGSEDNSPQVSIKTPDEQQLSNINDKLVPLIESGMSQLEEFSNGIITVIETISPEMKSTVGELKGLINELWNDNSDDEETETDDEDGVKDEEYGRDGEMKDAQNNDEKRLEEILKRINLNESCGDKKLVAEKSQSKLSSNAKMTRWKENIHNIRRNIVKAAVDKAETKEKKEKIIKMNDNFNKMMEKIDYIGENTQAILSDLLSNEQKLLSATSSKSNLPEVHLNQPRMVHRRANFQDNSPECSRHCRHRDSNLSSGKLESRSQTGQVIIEEEDD